MLVFYSPPVFLFLCLFDCSASIKKLQEQNESHQVNRARMEESMAVALEKKDQVKASFTHWTSNILCVAFLLL